MLLWPPIFPSASGARSSPIPAWWLPLSTRVTVNAHILETGTDSYRLRTTKTKNRRKEARANT